MVSIFIKWIGMFFLLLLSKMDRIRPKGVVYSSLYFYVYNIISEKENLTEYHYFIYVLQI